MKRIKEARRYAKALLNTVEIENIPQVITELSIVNELIVKSREFKSFLINPQITLDEREKGIRQIAGRLRLSENTVKFIMHLSELGVILALSEIIRIATALYLEKKRKAKAVVMTPIEIKKDYEERLKSSLKKLIDRDVDIEYVMDPSLLGGVLIKVGSTMYDTTIKGQLRLLRAELIR